jgi:Lrp/AsnC family transcriptional regulator, leucine-responsive regulatory protein
MATGIDKTDLKILKILQQDGRITNLQLSTEIGLSPAPTLERVKKLEKSGILKSYHAIVDTAALGLNMHAFMQITLLRHKANAINNFNEQIKQIDEVISCYYITGGSDYLLEIMVKDVQAFERLVMGKLSKIAEIGHMQTLVSLSRVKETRVIPLEY